jgi:hypothetical protein
VAPAIRLKVQRSASRERVLPVIYSDNYFALLPAETKVVTLEFDAAALAAQAPAILAEGWNIQPQLIPIA